MPAVSYSELYTHSKYYYYFVVGAAEVVNSKEREGASQSTTMYAPIFVITHKSRSIHVDGRDVITLSQCFELITGYVVR